MNSAVLLVNNTNNGRMTLVELLVSNTNNGRMALNILE